MVVSSAYGRDKPVPDVYLEEQKLVPINPLKNHNSSWRLANKFASRFSASCNTNSVCGKSNKNSKNRENDKMNNNPNNMGFLSDCEPTIYNKRCSISLNNSPTSNLAARLASRYGNGRQNAAPATTFSALTLANSVIPLKSRLKASLFNTIYDTGIYPTMNDIFFPNF
uniref:Uncharacterized protein n=1 Tax=Romanomermis culicivorax TaxID=13658 RepID=A0A915J1T9_ROMCU